MSQPSISCRRLPAAPTALALATVLTMAACGGGGSGRTATPPAVIVGTAAVGAPLPGAEVRLIDTAGQPGCTQAVLVADAQGGFRCELLPGRSAPFIVMVTDPDGAYPPMFSVAAQAPAAGQTATVNASPLTTVILDQLAGDAPAAAFAQDPSLLDASRLAQLPVVTGNVVAQLRDVLQQLGAPADYDPFTTPIAPATAAASGNAADQVLDAVRVTVVNGQPAFYSPADPDNPVPVADATTSDPPRVTPPPAGMAGLQVALRLAAREFTACFSHPLERRVLENNNGVAASEGGPEVIDVDEDCEDIAHDDYLNNGYRFYQQWHALLNDPAMTGASFSVPEVMLYRDSTRVAIVNIRYRTADGQPGSFITVMREIPGSGAPFGRDTDWWMYGNQQEVDSRIQAAIRRGEQLAPAGTPPFTGIGPSRYETGFIVYVNKDGPGSAGLRSVVVRGPGLPTAGLVLTAPDSELCTRQNWLNIRAKDGNDTPSPLASADTGNFFRVQRTMATTGPGATQIRPNPNEGNGNAAQFVVYAHPLDYGAAVGSTGYIDFSALRAMAAYRFAFFYGDEASPRYDYEKLILSPVYPAPSGASMQWVEWSGTTLAYLDPTSAQAAASSTLPVAWATNPLAEAITSAGVYTMDSTRRSVNNGMVPVARRASSTQAPAPAGSGCDAGETFPPLVADGISRRSIQLRYRMMDGSFKDQLASFN